MLALRAGHPLAAESLCSGLWGASAPRRLPKPFRATYRTCDGVAAWAIATKGSGYVLALDSASVDAHRFEEYLQEAVWQQEARNIAQAAAMLEAALTLWRGRRPELTEHSWATADVVRLEGSVAGRGRPFRPAPGPWPARPSRRRPRGWRGAGTVAGTALGPADVGPLPRGPPACPGRLPGCVAAGRGTRYRPLRRVGNAGTLGAGTIFESGLRRTARPGARGAKPYTGWPTGSELDLPISCEPGQSAVGVERGDQLPSGHVTFLCADGGLERLVPRLGDRFPPLLADHRSVIRGRWPPTEGSRSTAPMTACS